MRNKKDLGIYIHIPFCIQKCAYCDFLSAPADDNIKAAYVGGLTEEIKLMAKQCSEYIVRTVFFGGGTPSAIDEKLIGDIMAVLRQNYLLDSDAEITIECNPGTLNQDKAAFYRQCGINRISFGLQTVDNHLLKVIGRIHTAEDFEKGFEIARKAGFDNINIDVMSALPGQSVENYVEGLKRIVSYNPEHISAYSLILEEGTALCDNIDKYPPVPDEDDERKMYYETCKILSENGYEQYEISNFAKKGRICRHNLSYWERTDYLGFGIGAASLFNNIRINNSDKLEEYIEASKNGFDGYEREKIVLSDEDCMEEFMFLGLRKTEGICVSQFKELFGTDIRTVYGEVIKKNCGLKLLECYNKELNKEFLRLTKKGIDVSNVVLSEFLL